MTGGSHAETKLRDLLVKLFRVLGSDNAHEREAARGRIDELLHKHRKNWGDLAALLCIGPTTISPNLAAHIGALGSRDAAEQEDARRWVADLLALRRKSWNDPRTSSTRQHHRRGPTTIRRRRYRT